MGLETYGGIGPWTFWSKRLGDGTGTDWKSYSYNFALE